MDQFYTLSSQKLVSGEFSHLIKVCVVVIFVKKCRRSSIYNSATVKDRKGRNEK